MHGSKCSVRRACAGSRSRGARRPGRPRRHRCSRGAFTLSRRLNSLLNCRLNVPFQQTLCTADKLRDDLAGRLHPVNGSN
jgi:hypothetical protein